MNFQEHSESTVQHFDYLAENSKRGRFQPAAGWWSEFINNQILLQISGTSTRSDLRILEVGAGRGLYTLPLLKEGLAVTAVEMSEKSCLVMAQDAANENVVARLSIVQKDILAYESDSQFDVIFLADKFHHFEYDQTIEILRHLRKFSSSTTRIVAFEPNGSYPFWRFMHLINPDFVWAHEKNISHCTLADFRAKFAESGWSLIDYRQLRILPVPLLDRFPICRMVDNTLMRIPMLRRRSAYSLITAGLQTK